jgi:endonuclease/exonuclease/phosphatase (EEP) superfamily protein YafD
MSETVDVPPPPPASKRPSLARRLLSALTWLYLLALLTLYLLLRQLADRWWPATLLAFGPRWLFATPLLLLAPLALLFHRRALLPVAASILTLIPLLDFSLPWRALAPKAEGFPLRVLTCNVDRKALDTAAMLALLQSTKPDVVAFQEWNTDHRLPLFADRSHFRYLLRDGELCIASRYPLTKAHDVGHAWYQFTAGAAVRYEIETPAGVVDFYNLHLASPHFAFDKVIARADDFPQAVQTNSDHRRQQLEDLRAALAARPGHPAILVGDFNTPADTPDFRKNLGQLQDAFTTAGLGPGHTYFSRWTQTRIDHLLASNDFKILDCTIAPPVHSAHHPLITDLQLPTPQLP